MSQSISTGIIIIFLQVALSKLATTSVYP